MIYATVTRKQKSLNSPSSVVVVVVAVVVAVVKEEEHWEASSTFSTPSIT